MRVEMGSCPQVERSDRVMFAAPERTEFGSRRHAEHAFDADWRGEGRVDRISSRHVGPLTRQNYGTPAIILNAPVFIRKCI
jgi:hypothetical protein